MDRSFNTLFADSNSCCAYVTRESIYKEKIQQSGSSSPWAVPLSNFGTKGSEVFLSPRSGCQCGHALLSSTGSAHPAPISREGSRDVPSHHEMIITARSHQQQLCQLTMRLTRGICSEIWDYKVRTMLY